jgi:hypothetical protein
MAVASNSPFTSQILELKEKLDCEELNPFYEPPHNFKIVTVKQRATIRRMQLAHNMDIYHKK